MLFNNNSDFSSANLTNLNNIFNILSFENLSTLNGAMINILLNGLKIDIKLQKELNDKFILQSFDEDEFANLIKIIFFLSFLSSLKHSASLTKTIEEKRQKYFEKIFTIFILIIYSDLRAHFNLQDQASNELKNMPFETMISQISSFCSQKSQIEVKINECIQFIQSFLKKNIEINKINEFCLLTKHFKTNKLYNALEENLTKNKIFSIFFLPSIEEFNNDQKKKIIELKKTISNETDSIKKKFLEIQNSFKNIDDCLVKIYNKTSEADLIKNLNILYNNTCKNEENYFQLLKNLQDEINFENKKKNNDLNQCKILKNEILKNFLDINFLIKQRSDLVNQSTVKIEDFILNESTKHISQTELINLTFLGIFNIYEEIQKNVENFCNSAKSLVTNLYNLSFLENHNKIIKDFLENLVSQESKENSEKNKEVFDATKNLSTNSIIDSIEAIIKEISEKKTL